MNREVSRTLAIVVAIALPTMAIPERARGQSLLDLEQQRSAAMEAGNYRDAEQISRRGLEGAATIKNDELIAAWSNNLGMALYALNRFADAEPLYKRAQAIYERLLGPDHHNVAACLSNLAVLYMDQGRFAEAEPLYKRERAIEEKDVGPEHPDYATSLNNLANLYRFQARYADAEPLYKQAIVILEKALGPEHPDLARSLNNLAILKEGEGRYAEAEPLYKRALAIRERSRGAEHEDVANTLQHLASMFEIQGRYNEARPLLLRALAIYEKGRGGDDLVVGNVLNDLANMDVDQHLYAEAEPRAKRAIEILEKGLGPDHGGVVPPLDTLANAQFRQGRLAEATRLLERALAIKKKACADDDVTAYCSFSLAQVQAAQGHADRAEQAVGQAITLAEKVGMGSGFRSTLYNFRAELARQAGRRDTALEDLRKAMKLADDQRGMISGGEVERAASFADYSGVYERMVAWQVEFGSAGVAAALDALERSRARSLLDEITLAGVDLQAGRSAAERAQLEREGAGLRERVVRLEKQIGSAAADPSRIAEVKRLEGELAEARRSLYEHVRDIRTSSPLYRALLNRGSGPPALDQIQRRLCSNGGLLLVYLFGRDGGFVIAIGQDRARLSPLKLNDADAKALGVAPGPLTAERLQSVLVGSRGSGIVPRLADPKATSPAPLLAVLWHVLVPEAERKGLLDGTTKRLIVVPDGPLAFLPFETLVVEMDEAPRFLLDDGPPVVYAPSATILMGLADRADRPAASDRDPVLAVGDPAYPQAGAVAGAGPSRGLESSGQRFAIAGGSLPRLPFSGLEAQWVARAFNDAGIKAGLFTGSNATEAGIRFWGPGRKIIHLACHGLTDQSLGNFFGALAVAPGPNGAADPADDGFLTLSEIYGLDLKGCEVAMLSACQTNFGPQQRGEGTWSLSRGFLVAGVRRVVASNWLVDDEAAANLMSVFCTGLAGDEKAGKAVDYAGALHRARRWVRGQEKWKAPYFWASLVLVGPP